MASSCCPRGPASDCVRCVGEAVRSRARLRETCATFPPERNNSPGSGWPSCSLRRRTRRIPSSSSKSGFATPQHTTLSESNPHRSTSSSSPLETTSAPAPTRSTARKNGTREVGFDGVRRQSGLLQRLDPLRGCVRNRVQIVHEDWGWESCALPGSFRGVLPRKSPGPQRRGRIRSQPWRWHDATALRHEQDAE